jgi:L-fucose mutarotase
MLKLPVLHPEILAALGRAGHLGKVLITDGNYPHNTRVNPRAPIVWANFAPGLISATQALQMVCDLIPVEAVAVMAPDKTGEYAMNTDPPIWAEFATILSDRAQYRGELTKLFKPQFNESARSEDTCLVIATAEQRIWSNIILTIGVVK